MPDKQIEEARGVVQEFSHHDTYGDSFKMDDKYYNYSKDGPTSTLPRVRMGDRIEISYVLWQRQNSQGVMQTRRYLQSIKPWGTMEDDGDPPWETAEEAMLLEPRTSTAQTTNTQSPPPTNGRAPTSVAQPANQSQRSLESLPGVYTMSPGLLARIEAGKIAATYLAHKEVDTDEALLRCAELVEGWLLEDRPHFVTED